jgi:gelsolin
LSDASGQLEFDEVGRGQGISLRLLDPNDVFVVDLGFHVFVWIGQKASRAERDQAPGYARAYVRRYNRPEHLHVERVMDGGENELLCAFLSGH